MKLQTKILLIVVAVFGLGLYYLLKTIVDDIKPSYREALESPLIDLAEILAADVAQNSSPDGIAVEKLDSILSAALRRPLSANIYGYRKQHVDLRIYVTNKKGILLYHSKQPELVGSDFSQWNDVLRTLRGEYGARSTRDDPSDPKSSVLYIAAPILSNGQTIGVLTVGKPAAENNNRVARATNRVVAFGGLVALGCILIVLLLSFWVFQPVTRFTEYVKKLQTDERLPAPHIRSGEIRNLAEAFEDLREKLEGKKYVENYIQALTHEMKSPLTAIKAASEVLQGELSAKDRQHFLERLNEEIDRIDSFVRDLLALSRIERITELPSGKPLALASLVQQSLEPLTGKFREKNITLSGLDTLTGTTFGDPVLLGMVFSNIVHNALEFSPPKSNIEIQSQQSTDSRLLITVRDEGTGIPDYALPRLFERFYSLPRPDSGKKGSGLGLLLVRDILKLHNGSISITNRFDRSGAEVRIELPQGSP